MTGTISTNETLNGGVEAIPTLSGTLSGNATSSYNSLSDKPIINGTTLEGGVDRSLVEDVKVNGVSVVTDYVAQIKSYKEVTQAEYNALPSSKLTDGIMYCIKDSEFSAEDVPYDNTDSQAQSTDVQGALDEAFQRTIDIGTWFTDVVAESYNYIKHYTVGDYVFYFPSIGVTKLYRCIENTSGAFDSTKWEEVKIADEIKEVNSTIDNLLIQKSIENTDIASFSDGSNLPMPSLKVGIEPQQDLHGYDSPWVGGAGKNKFPIATATSSGTQNIFSKQPLSLSAGSYVLSFNSATPTTNNMSISFFNGDTQVRGSDITPGTTTVNFTFDQNITSVTWYVREAVNLSNIMIESGSTKTTFAPYSNICPISGWTEEVITVADDLQNPTVTHTTTIPFVDGQGQSVEVFGGSVDVVNGTSGNKKIYDIVVFDGSEDEVITLYNANRGGFWLGTIDSMKDYSLVSQKPPFVSDYLKTVSQSSDWISGVISEDRGSKRIVACLSNFGTSVEECRQYLSQHPLTIRYELATPTTFYTHPTSINSLEGTNNVWGDTGKIEELEYLANATDVIASLDARITALENA